LKTAELPKRKTREATAGRALKSTTPANCSAAQAAVARGQAADAQWLPSQGGCKLANMKYEPGSEQNQGNANDPD